MRWNFRQKARAEAAEREREAIEAQNDQVHQLLYAAQREVVELKARLDAVHDERDWWISKHFELNESFVERDSDARREYERAEAAERERSADPERHRNLWEWGPRWRATR